MEDSVNLTCHTDFKGQLTWKHNGKVLPKTEYAEMRGHDLILHELGTPDAGDYSCWGGGEKLDHTYLLLQVEHNEVEEDLSCLTQTYSCSFTCHWSLKDFTVARLQYHRDGQDPGRWKYADHSTSRENVFVFDDLSLSNSPFTEESSPIVVTAEAVSDSLYLKRTHRFYLRNIVQPDPPQSVLCERNGQKLTVTVEPPSSWAEPLSYFPLEHQIEYMYKDNGETKLSDNTMIPRGISKLRARSRDPLVESAWSEWSPWKNVTN
ncbi:interleukin-12 subunit beta [Megalops cyprinoides]|uniref:interleukin-12 subunit beta n=1 Tax=Megalops cyprinoides TaxID=118141 RepID=UPI00186501F9|nr:interleukin-12 subunit beta [Megalops cyprinoides]